ncbi:hypothetical protein ITP53_23005 [Nonomuraea sp. K274]|uniref:Uncharacterized protein n=1 Tax=Nonomuraea cypriaca TaxID=1187855 RepID=A0A931F0F2_9ACTN|nr:hypothetical protein [Nonomuraea cypriaca]MBF8188542.1 hypothetical protein [Nonomuraea cypriaca]
MPEPTEPEPVPPAPGMTISIRSRRDVVVVDPDRFMAAARQAYRAANPGLTEAEAAEAVVDVYDAVHALLDRDGRLVPDGPERTRPGVRVHDRPDGLSPAGWEEQIVIDDPMPLQDYGCFPLEDPFALPSARPQTQV